MNIFSQILKSIEDNPLGFWELIIGGWLVFRGPVFHFHKMIDKE